jgi:hypothetical protein
MGGFAAYNLGMRHRDGFGVVVGVFPPLNLRWTDKAGHYMAKFDPYDWGWRNTLGPRDVLGRFNGGLTTIRVQNLFCPLFGDNDEDVMAELVQNNPIELVNRTGLRDGELAMYVAYAGQDEFNIDAQVESFLYFATFKGLSIGVGYAPKGHHDLSTALELFGGIVSWLGPIMAPYSPPLACTCPPPVSKPAKPPRPPKTPCIFPSLIETLHKPDCQTDGAYKTDCKAGCKPETK